MLEIKKTEPMMCRLARLPLCRSFHLRIDSDFAKMHNTSPERSHKPVERRRVVHIPERT